MNRRMEAYERAVTAQRAEEYISCDLGADMADAIRCRLNGDKDGEKEAQARIRSVRRKLERAIVHCDLMNSAYEVIATELDAKSESRRLAKLSRAGANGSH